MQFSILIIIILSLYGCAAETIDISNSDEKDTHILAESGDVAMQHKLCFGYSYGKFDFEQSDQKALKWCEMAAKSGALSSITLLAEKYYFGYGVEKSYETALQLYEGAAVDGHLHAQYMMATFYEEGIVVEKNLDTAKYWLELSIDQGYPIAQEMLDKINKLIENEQESFIQTILRLANLPEPELGEIYESVKIQIIDAGGRIKDETREVIIARGVMETGVEVKMDIFYLFRDGIFIGFPDNYVGKKVEK